MSSSTLDLATKHCIPCEGGVPLIEKGQAEDFLKQLLGWQLTPDAKGICKEWTVKDFMTGIRFFEQVAKLAESEGHHPDLHLQDYRKMRIELSTHAIGGLSENDFILAAKIDQLPVQRKNKGD